MSRFVEVLQTVLPVLVMLCIGMICRKRSIITREGINTLKSVVVNITLPAVLIGVFASSEYSLMDIVVPLIMFVVCFTAWLLGFFAEKAFHMNSRFVPYLTTGFEAGMLGYALFNMLYGSGELASMARLDLGQVLFVFTIYKILLGLNDPHKKSISISGLMKEMVLSPTIISITAGVLIGATGLYRALTPSGISGILTACTDFVSAPTSAIILLTIGYDLVFSDIPWVSAGKAVALRFVIMMALRFVMVLVLNLIFKDSGMVHAINVMFILPPPFVLPVFADDAGQRVYVSSVLSLSTVVSIVGFAVLAVIGA